MYKFKVKDLGKKDKELKKLMKKCTKCKELKLIKKFDKASAKKDGFNQECKECKRNRYFHICIQCGKEFRSGKKENKFCSRKCMGMYSDNKEEVSCDYCGKIFRKRKLKVSNDKKDFCSRECCGEYQKKRITITCEYCKKSFDTVPSKMALHEHHYCSQQCANLANTKIGEKNPKYNPNMTDEEREIKRNYNEYYEWRKQVFKRDNYTCQCCGKCGGSLVAHHLNGYDNFKEHRTDVLNGITLCKNCHNELHSIYGKGNNTIEQFRDFLYNKYLQTKGIKYLVALEDTNIRKYAMKLEDKEG